MQPITSTNTGASSTTTIPPAVAATAGSAAFCKWSLFRRGYLDAWGFPPETLALLAALAGVDDDAASPHRTPPSASPLAHRCYHLRAAVVGEALRRMWRSGGKGGTVVVLGAGMDGLGLASLAGALDCGSAGAVRLIEVDCPEVVGRKEVALRKAVGVVGWLSGLLKGGQQQQHYRLVSADLREPEGSVAGALAPLCLSSGEERDGVLFVMEAVLGYLPPERATALLRWIAATHRHAAVLIVDTGCVASLAAAEPKDAVAHAVLGAFAARGCPIEGLREWARDGPSVAHTLRQYGFPHAWPSDLWDAGAALVPADRLLVPSASMEDPFDEYAAWQLFARQSLVAVAGTDAGGPLFEALTQPPPSSTTATRCPGHQAAQVRALEAAAKEGSSRASAGGPSDTTTNSITIRCFRPEDAEAVRALVATGRAGAAAGRPAVARFLRKALDGDLADMDERYAGGERFWVMVDGVDAAAMVVIGCVGLRVAEPSEEGEIVRLTVADGWQRRGLGRRLLRHAEAHARDRCGLALLRATTLDETALPGACAFYVAEGYVEEGRQPFGKGQGELCHLRKGLV